MSQQVDQQNDREDPDAASAWMWGISGAVITLAFALGVIWVASAQFSQKRDQNFDEYVSPARVLKEGQEQSLNQGPLPIQDAMKQWIETENESRQNEDDE